MDLHAKAIPWIPNLPIPLQPSNPLENVQTREQGEVVEKARLRP